MFSQEPNPRNYTFFPSFSPLSNRQLLSSQFPQVSTLGPVPQVDPGELLVCQPVPKGVQEVFSSYILLGGDVDKDLEHTDHHQAARLPVQLPHLAANDRCQPLAQVFLLQQ